MYPQYRELRPISGWHRFTSLRHPSKFQRVSRVGFVTAPTSFNGRQPNFAQCFSTSWAGTLYIHFGGSCPLTEFLQVQNLLCVQVLHYPILAALLHSTRAVSVRQSLRRGTRNAINQLSQTAPPISDRAATTLGIGPHSSIFIFLYFIALFFCDLQLSYMMANA